MSDQVDLMQYHVLVGPSIVTTAGAGIMSLDADEVTRLLEKQVQRYQEKARSWSASANSLAARSPASMAPSR